MLKFADFLLWGSLKSFEISIIVITMLESFYMDFSFILKTLKAFSKSFQENKKAREKRKRERKKYERAFMHRDIHELIFSTLLFSTSFAIDSSRA